MQDTLLIVDDEKDLLHGLKRTITMEIDCRVLLAENGAHALNILEKEPVDLVLADIRMPVLDGISLLRAVKEKDPAVSVIIMTAFGTVERAVEAVKAGAYDFIQKPMDGDRLIHMIKRGLELNRLVRENARLMAKACEQQPFGGMVGRSTPAQEVFRTIEMLAQTDVTVLILGETGTGKDLAAQALHNAGSRHTRPMVTVNCPALPEGILESELFGYRKGAFTGADRDKKGFFDQADGSTLFLDEIGDLSTAVQTKLLRVLQDKEIIPLGDTQSHKVDVRIIAATNQNLEEKLKTQEFREDLFYRLNVATLTLPPLREISEDIPFLADHFLEKIALEQGTAPKKLTPEVMNHLLMKPWPGNIRELENTIRGWCAVTADAVIRLNDIAQSGPTDRLGPVPDDFSLPYKTLKARVIDEFTMAYLHRLLGHTQGNVSLSAKISGIKRQSLQKIIRRYQLDVGQYRD